MLFEVEIGYRFEFTIIINFVYEHKQVVPDLSFQTTTC